MLHCLHSQWIKRSLLLDSAHAYVTLVSYIYIYIYNLVPKVSFSYHTKIPSWVRLRFWTLVSLSKCQKSHVIQVKVSKVSQVMHLRAYHSIFSRLIRDTGITNVSWQLFTVWYPWITQVHQLKIDSITCFQKEK